MEIIEVYPLDAVYDTPDDVRTNKRYAGASNWTVKEVAETVKNDFGSIDILVHSLANGPEVTKPLLETSRKGLPCRYICIKLFLCIAAQALPSNYESRWCFNLLNILLKGQFLGMVEAQVRQKQPLRAHTRVLAFEAGKKGEIRVNTISAGPLGSRAAKAIGFIKKMREYSYTNAPLQKELSADEVGNRASFLVSPLALVITGSVVYVDNGLNTMGLATDSLTLAV